MKLPKRVRGLSFHTWLLFARDVPGERTLGAWQRGDDPIVYMSYTHRHAKY